MPSLMYKDGEELMVSDDPDGRAIMASQGWKEAEVKEEPKPLSMPKVSDDNSSRNSK